MGDIQSSSEITSTGVTLYKGLNSEAFIPQHPKIPPVEGLQVQIAGAHDATDTPKQIAQRYLQGLGAAKVITESGITKDSWGNTRIENGQEVNAYGRVASEEDSWRKPVDTHERGATSDDLSQHYDVQKLQRLFSSYIPKWEALGKHMELFKEGVNGVDQVVNAENIFDTPIWTNGRLEVKIMQQSDPLKGPWLHLNGFHLLVAPTEKFQRQWQTITETNAVAGIMKDPVTGETIVDESQKKMIQEYIQLSLEGVVVSLGIRELLAQGKGEIHNSGNWAGGLKTTDELLDPNRPEKGTGKVDLSKASENPKKEKRAHFTRIIINAEGKPVVKKESDYNTATHFHVYIPHEDGPVRLPEMWPWEAQQKLEEAKADSKPTDQFEKIISDWQTIKPLTPEQIQEVGTKLGNGNLTNWLQKNGQGTLQ